ncbi:MAG: tetratricopeptide repeat protein, partial [Candidatus Binatia bacterium]
VDRQSDLFSFGVVMYEMATGQLPFKGEHDAAILYSIVNEEPLPVTTLNPNIDQELERIIHKALGKEVEDRYQHADDMAADLKKQKKDLESGRARTDLTKPKIATKNRMYLYGGFVLLLIFLVVAGLFLFTGNEKAIDSIAVLPMENISGDPEQEYFADGMTEALITNLSKIRVLKVISRTSAMRYKGTDKPLPEIARELNVDAVVEGTVLRIGNRVRITAQLIEAATDQHLWAESYERDLRDVLALQSEVARAIAREIRIAITQEEEARLATALPVNPEAYQLYLLGRFFWNKHTEEGLKKAVKFFGRSVEKEPNYAPAYAGLADTYIYFEDLGLQRPKEAYPRAKAAAMKALKLDSTLAEAHSSLGLVRFWFDWDWSGAETAFKRAIELNPSYSIAHLRYAQLLMVRGRLVEAHTAITRAWELDPLSLRANIFLGMYSYLTRAYDHAIEQHKKTLELNPSYHLAHFYLGLAYEAKGLEEDAIAAFEKAVTTGGGTIAVAWLGHAYAEAGYKSEALKILDELKERSNGEYVPPFAIAVIYEGLGDTDSTFEWLGKAYQERSSWIPFIKGLPWFDSLHGDPRFTVLLKKIGLEK